MKESILTTILERTCTPDLHVFLGKKDWIAKQLSDDEIAKLKEIPDCSMLGEIQFEGRQFAAYRVGWYIRFVDCELHG